MNKTIDISLAGLLFHLEETAYYKLKNYLEHVRNSLHGGEDIDEIMNEVEARIAELLMQKQQNPNEVVNEKQIDEIIEIIGKPEDFEEEETEHASSTKIKKRLFRDPDHAMIGGVAAGFAHYLGIDITLMRILFLILLFVTQGSFLLIYIILWIIIPKAKTVSDKLKMKGEEVSLDNIVENVNNEHQTGQSPLGENIERVGTGIGEVLSKLIGLLLAFISGIVLLGLLISALAISPMSDMSLIIHNDTAVFQQIGIPFMWLNILVLLLVGIPFILLFILGLKLLFPHIKALSKNILLILGTIWIISFVVLTVKSISGLAHKSFNADVIETYPISFAKDTLVLKTETEVGNLIKNAVVDDDISIDFKASPDNKFHIKLIKNAEGISLYEARKTAEELSYHFRIDSLKGSLVLPEEFTYPKKRAYSDYDLEVIILIPNGKAVKIYNLNKKVFYGKSCKAGDVIYNKEGEIQCSSNHGEQQLSTNNDHVQINSDHLKISVNDQGVKIKAKDKRGKKAVIEINEKGVNINNSQENE
jgi:phage shock protein PspC (stress-responsive transcriptional regulator)